MSAHRSPRRLLSATPEQWEAWDAAARAHGTRWATWARRMLDTHTKVVVICDARRGPLRCALERGHRGPHYTGPVREKGNELELELDDDELDDEHAGIRWRDDADIRPRRRLLP